MILMMRLGACDSNSIVVGSAWRVVELYCMLARPPLRRTSAAGGWQLRPTLREQPLTPVSDDTHCTESNQPTRVEVDQVTTNTTPISAPRSQLHTHRQHGCPLRSSPPLRDYGMMRHGALCDREDPMLTRSCSLLYAYPQLPRIPPCDTASILKYIHTVLRRYRCWSLQDQEHSERRQEAQALGGPVGQTEYVTSQLHRRSREDDCGRLVETAARNLCDEREEGTKHTWLTYPRSDGPRPPPHRLPTRTSRSAYRAGWFRAQQWLEGRLHIILWHTVHLGTYH